jgi:hypothetical protein
MLKCQATPVARSAESPSFALSSLASTHAELALAPDSDCLNAGDEVLLINLQGTPQATENVGNGATQRGLGQRSERHFHGGENTSLRRARKHRLQLGFGGRSAKGGFDSRAPFRKAHRARGLASRGFPAGGIVLLLTQELSVGSTGKISATSSDDQRDVSSSGGTVLIRGQSLNLGTGRVTALGSVAHGISGATSGLSNQSSPGYVILETSGTVDGSSDPVANVVPQPTAL